MLLLLLACHKDKDETVKTSGEGLFEKGCPVEGHATARTLTELSERPWGEEALAQPGDVLLMNERAAFVIQGPDDPDTYYHYGGGPIDAVAVKDCEQTGPELLEEIGFVVGTLALTDFNSSSLHQIRATEVEIVSDGSDGGPAVVDVHATDDRFWLVELTLIRNVWEDGSIKELGDLFGLDITIRYTLDPDSQVLQTSLILDGNPTENGFMAGALVFPSDMTPVHTFSNDNLGVGGFNMLLGVPWLAQGAHEGSTVLAMPGANTAYTEVSGVRALLDANLAVSPLTVGEGEAPEVQFLLGVGATDPASAGATLEPYLDEPIPGLEVPWKSMEGTVTDPSGKPVSEATVSVYAEAGPDDWRILDRLSTDKNGHYSGRILDPSGSYQLVATQEGRDSSPTETDFDLVIGAWGTLTPNITDENGDSLPVRIEAERDDGFTQVLYAMPGDSLPLPPGHYTVWASRGYEYEIIEQEVTVPEDGDAKLTATMAHLLTTTGWASTDTHVHAAPSADSDTLMSERVKTVAASGLDSFVSTDHEAIIDLSPAIAEAGLTMTYGLGSEVTATVPEHVNAWPFPAVDDPRGESVEWYGMGFPGIYAAIRERGAQVIQLNHSRVNYECGILCVLDWDRMGDPTTDMPEGLGLDPGTEIWSWDFDSFEVMNGLRSPYLVEEDPRHTGALVDWLAFHNLGYQVAGMAVTDVHGLELPGSPRTYVKVPDDAPGMFDENDLAQGVLAGATVISAGAFAEVSVDGVGPGELTPIARRILSIHVEALPGVDVTEVKILANCDLLETIPTYDPDGVVKLDTQYALLLTQDVHIVIVGIGTKDMPRGLENYDASTVPRFITSPIFVDGDFDGVWTAPGPKSCDTGL